MVIHDFDRVRVTLAPFKTNPPLVVDSDAALPLTVPLQALQAIPRQSRDRLKIRRGIEQVQFAQRRALDGPEATRGFPLEETRRIRAAEGPDHLISIYWNTLNGKR